MKRRYLRSVRALLDCPPKERKRLMSRLDRALTAYLEDFPEAGETDLTASFGTPQECAARLLAECPPDRVAAERQKKDRRHRTVIAVLAVLLAFVVGIAVYLCRNSWTLVFQIS